MPAFTKSLLPSAVAMALLVANVAVDASFTSLGCYSEPSSGRAIEAKSYSDSAMTTESCAAFCADYQLFGTEYSEQCFCGNSLASGSSPATGCTMNCAGDSSETCGGPSRLSRKLTSLTHDAE